ncbi:MAG: outer membrane beta-barrel protein [Bacteroidetes bacterium]|nr:outer membrane beta-barrel protein [Bacteroidota bacterium]
MKKRLVLLFILVSCRLCYSQTYNERPAVLEIGYGVSVPFGKFESTDVNDSASGYATAGTCLNVMFTYLVNKNFGVAAMINSTANRLYTEGVKNRFNSYIKENIGDDAVISDIHLEKWNTMAYMAGGYVTYPLQKASFNLQLLAGYSRTKYPEVDVTVFKDTSFDAISVNQSSDEVASAFCINVGAGLKYNISDIMCLCVNANFFSSYPEFEKVVTSSTYQGNTPDEYHRVHQRISQLNVTAGIGFRF